MTLTKWATIASNQLLGRRIVEVRYMTDAEMAEHYWTSKALVLVLDNGLKVYAAEDEEGNEAGVLMTNDLRNPVLPAWRTY
jgi:hypothetical protein